MIVRRRSEAYATWLARLTSFTARDPRLPGMYIQPQRCRVDFLYSGSPAFAQPRRFALHLGPRHHGHSETSPRCGTPDTSDAHWPRNTSVYELSDHHQASDKGILPV